VVEDFDAQDAPGVCQPCRDAEIIIQFGRARLSRDSPGMALSDERSSGIQDGNLVLGHLWLAKQDLTGSQGRCGIMRHPPAIVGLCLSAVIVISSTHLAGGTLQEPPQWLPVPLPTVSLPDPSRLPIQREFPDPLVMFDGRRVTTREQWEKERKPELRTLFQHYMYGYMPPPPRNLSSIVEQTQVILAGEATRKDIRLFFGPFMTPPLSLMLVVPNNRSGPSPVFLGLNFDGNDAAGTWFAQYPVRHLIEKGYAVATVARKQIHPDIPAEARDRPDALRGLGQHFRRPGQTAREPHDWGAIAMWAWGLQRVVDYLVTDSDIDARRIAVTGLSRLGKAALLAAAFDERIALVIPHQSCLGGVAPTRTRNQSPTALTAKKENTNHPHFFSLIFHRFNDQVDRLPFDQDSLVALVAPRPVLVTAGVDDKIDDPPGAFAVLKAADRVYRFLGVEGLSVTEPVFRATVGKRLAYHLSGGGHGIDPPYWRVFTEFSDRYMKQ